MNTGEVQLCKWWQTPSAQRSFARAQQARRERIDAMRASMAERKAKLEAEVWEGVAR